MNIIILGMFKDNELSPSTINALNQVDKLDQDINIDLLLNNKDLEVYTLEVAPYIDVFNYPHVTGNNISRYKEIIKHHITKKNPDLIIVAVDNEEQIVPLLGQTLEYESFIDVKKIELKTEGVIITKSEYSGNVEANYLVINNAVFSYRHHQTNPLRCKVITTKQITHVPYSFKADDYVISQDTNIKTDFNLSDAKFVIVCGFGIGSKENIHKIQEYAKAVDAVVAGTKKVIDSGWLPVNLLIGQTGHIIAPDVCLTIGVSGAAPLLNGILESKTIIAINKDKDARIFNYADYGVVGDYQEILKEGIDKYESNK